MSFENNFKQFLKESGCNEEADESMSKKELLDLQTAINNSKDTASIEEEKREYVRQAEEMIKAKNDIITASPEPAVEEKSFTFKPRNSSESPADLFDSDSEFPSCKEFAITFQDMPESSKKSLEIVFHNPVYSLPIPTNSKYKKYTIQERADLLLGYYTKIGELKMKMARKSLHWAPYSKPIQPSVRCKNSLLKSASNNDDVESPEEPTNEISPQEIYISRAGRQVKRKIYTEDLEVDNDLDFQTSSKKNKSINSDTKITMDIPYVPEENHNEEKNIQRAVKTKKDTPKRFLPLSTKKLTRSDMLFEALKNDDVKSKQKEKEMDDFEKTLPTLEESEDDTLLMDNNPGKDEVTEENDENFVRRRVPPPIPVKKGTKLRKQSTQEDFDRIDVIPSSSSSPTLKQYTNLNRSLDTKKNSKTVTKGKPLNEETSISKLEKVECPICAKKFLQSEIQDHASNCGEEEIEEFPENSSREYKRITCELCDQVFEATTMYEVHVKHCMAKRVVNL